MEKEPVMANLPIWARAALPRVLETAGTRSRVRPPDRGRLDTEVGTILEFLDSQNFVSGIFKKF